MYSGTTLTKVSGRIIGAHQKIDRVARKHLAQLLPDDTYFPKSRRILEFEGNRGPDAIKRKSPSKDEPSHFYNPFDDTDKKLQNMIQDHYDLLVEHLRSHNKERAAFEASWLAHALVDGLTPAHHYPFDEKMAELSAHTEDGSRDSVRKKIVMPGVSYSDLFRNNWRAWGPRGLRTAHGLFEIGVATLIAPLSFSEAYPKAADLEEISKIGITKKFEQVAREIAVLGLYETYIEKGWTPRLAYRIRHTLGPQTVQMVTLAWYAAAKDAGLV